LLNLGYNAVTEDVLEELKAIVGAENVLTRVEGVEDYTHDESPLKTRASPEVVVKPGGTSEVAKILALANMKRIPVTPRGAGTGLCGGAVPVFGGLVLSLERMNRLLEIDPDNLMVTVEAGMRVADLHREVEKYDLLYPPDPGEKTATIGGNISTNAGGMRAVKYGVTRDYVKGLEVVLATGEVLRIGGKIVKNSTGYDLLDLIVGSEGTLAVVTKAILKLVPKPRFSVTLYVPFPSIYDAAKAVFKTVRRKVLPTAVEFAQRDIVVIAETYTGMRLPHRDAEAYLIIRLDGNTDEELKALYEDTCSVCLENKALDVYVAKGRDQDRIWEVRSSFFDALKSLGPFQVLDVAVPRSRIPAFVEGIEAISRRHQVRVVSFGHAGDGNVHVHVFEPGASKVVEEVYRLGVSLGGTVSGEHGLGFEKKRYARLALSVTHLEIMRGIKKVFDPNNVLNPGKVFD